MACKPIRIRLTIYYGVIDMACKPMRIRLTSYYGNKVFYLIFTGCVYHAFLYNEPVIKFLNFYSISTAMIELTMYIIIFLINMQDLETRSLH